LQTTDKAEKISQINDFQGWIVVEKSPRGRRLKQPIAVKIPENLTQGEKAVRQYVIDAFCWKMAELIHFTFRNETVLKLATRLFYSTNGSEATLYQYTYGVYAFFKWLTREPDSVVRECLETRSTDEVSERIDGFVGELKARQLASGTIANHVKGVKALFRANGIELTLPYRIDRRVRYADRSPTQQELQKIIDFGDIRDKAIVSILALSGMRIGTLVKLEYRHVKNDLDAGIIPLHIHCNIPS